MTTTRPDACLGTTPAEGRLRRGAYLALGAGLTAFALIEVVRFGGAAWFALAFLLLPDVALVSGASRDLEPGRLHRFRTREGYQRAPVCR